MPKYDFLIVGAGLYGATCARLLTDKGYKCIIIEKENHVGGMCHTELNGEIMVHTQGAHIFHTNNEHVWEFVNKYGKFNNYVHKVLAFNNDKLYHLPITLQTFYDVYGKIWPNDSAKCLLNEVKAIQKKECNNLEEYAISLVGQKIYNLLIKDYTEKQWGAECKDLPIDIIKRIPLRFNYDDRYFTDKYQGIPIDGYTKLIENIIGEDIDIMLNKDYLLDKEKYNKLAEVVIYSGEIDKLCNYVLGALPWRSLRFVTTDSTKLKQNNVIGTAVMNFTGKDYKWTRIIEHKWFTPEKIDNKNFNNRTIITYEYPEEWDLKKPAYYPINTDIAMETYDNYIDMIAEDYPNMIVGGRLGSYRYMNMDTVIEEAFNLCEQL